MYEIGQQNIALYSWLRARTLRRLSKALFYFYNMIIEKRLLTPALAEMILTQNDGNRRVRKDVVQKYAKEMLAGRWKEDTGETIKISKQGTLLDGQHRLLALIKSGKNIHFHVSSEMDSDIFDVIDAGAIRNSSDAFCIADIPRSNALPSIIQTYFYIKSGLKNTTIDRRLSTSNLLEVYNERPIFWDETSLAANAWYVSFAKILPPSVIGGFYSVAKDISESDAIDFMNQLCNGIECCYVVSLCRRQLMQDKMAPRKVKPNVRIIWVIKAWNAFRTKNTSLKILKFDSERDSVPIPI